MMGKYPEAEDRGSTAIHDPDATVVDLESYRRRRNIEALDTNANQKPREPGGEAARACNTPVEGNRQE
jgi:hypothetical protein